MSTGTAPIAATGTRPLSAAELRQRQEAAVKSGGYSDAKIDAVQRREYGRLIARLHYALGQATGSGKTTLAMRSVALEYSRHAARYLVAVAWLDQRPHPLVRDEDSGEPWPLLDRATEWQTAAGRLMAQLVALLPDGAEPDLSGLLGGSLAVASGARRGR